VDGVHYHFINRSRFEQMRAGGELLESAEVHGNLYGTPRQPIEQALAEGRDVLFDLNYQGTLQLYETMRDHIVSVFILPPNVAALKNRLERRAEDSPEAIRRRLMTARIEGFSRADSDAILEDLFDISEDPSIVYEHKWELGDMVIWDNWCSIHARKDFPREEPRLMRRLTIEGQSMQF
jgi:guanylate kinase